MKLKTLSLPPQVTDLSPLKGMPLEELGLTFSPWRDTELLHSLKTLKKINGKPAAEFWKEAEARQAAFEAWVQRVQRLRSEKQVEAVAAKLKELNPGFDGKMRHEVEGNTVVKLELWTDAVTDISPVRALTGLKKLACRGSAPGRGKLSDLWPLKGMSLKELWCDLQRERDAALLRSLKTLERINGTAATQFWKEVAAGGAKR
jgi:hypothetical protein